MGFAAQILNSHHKDVKTILWDPIIDGDPCEWKRYLTEPHELANGKKKKARWALHEAFKPNQIIGVNCVLPEGLSIDAFERLLGKAGAYKGISPYKPADGYGTFEVISVRKRGRPATQPDAVEEELKK